jgi:glycosyltransferase involved in cell wall biosynthesis
VKILCMNYEYPPIGGGGSAACRGLSEALVERGNEVDVVTSGMKGLPSYDERGGVRIHRVSCIRRHRHFVTTPELATQVLPSYRKALALLNGGGHAVNHTHFIIPTGLTSYLLWRKKRLPYVLTLHGSDVPGYNPDRFRFEHALLKPLWRTIIRRAARLISPSEFLKELVQRRIDVPVEVVPHGISLPKAPDRPKRNRIIVVTRIFERKGIQFFLQALNGLDTDWEICIAGDGPYLPTLRELAKGIDKEIDFLGFLQGEELIGLYDSAKIFVFPSIQENFPIVLLEAMNAGCAVITSTVPGCAEVVRDAAIKVPPGNVEELKKALRRLIDEPEEIERLGRCARRRVRELSWESVAGTYEKIFADCVE